ncbi:MAG: NADH-quinone oxidoreductase subunit K, partial [Pseudomonadota bacterium]
VANALPQALILTAIVIGFGLLTFALALTYRAYQALGTIDVDAMRVAEPATQVDDEKVAKDQEGRPEPSRQAA